MLPSEKGEDIGFVSNADARRLLADIAHVNGNVRLSEVENEWEAGADGDEV